MCRAELDQQAAEVERQRHQLTGAARTQAQLSQLETELARREQDMKVGSCFLLDCDSQGEDKQGDHKASASQQDWSLVPTMQHPHLVYAYSLHI